MSEGEQRDELGRFVDDGGREPGRPPRSKRGRRMYFKHFKVDAALTDPADRAAYEKLLADPNTTVPILRAFLLERGHNIGTNAISHHRIHRHFEAKAAAELAQMAAAYCELTRRHGAGAISEASQARFEIMLLQRLFESPDAPKMPAAQWAALSRLVRRNVVTRQDVEQLREDVDRREKQAAEAERFNRGRSVTGADVAQRMKEILGV